MTPPYFHDGSVATLPQAVRVMAHVQLGVTLNDTDTRDIMAFLESLTGAAGELRQGPGPSARHLVTSRKRDRREAAQLMLWFLQRNPVQVPFNGGSGALTLAPGPGGLPATHPIPGHSQLSTTLITAARGFRGAHPAISAT